MARPRRAAAPKAQPTKPVDDAEASDYEEEPQPAKPAKRATKKRTRRAKADDTDESDVEVAPKPAKRARRGKKTRAGLEKLVDMPLDFIWLLVFKLQPIDILSLARTCKTLNGFFMGRGSARYWEIAAQNIEDLPPKPDCVSWPAFISFLFSSVCQNCGKNGCENLFWDCAARYCGACKKKISTLHTTAYDSQRTLQMAFADMNIPYPMNQIPLRCIVPRIGDSDFSKLVVEKLRASMSQLQPEQLYAFIEEKAKALSDLRDHRQAVDKWMENNKAARAGERRKNLEARCKSIKEKLISLGWKDELSRMPATQFRSHHLVAQPKLLTDRIWKNIQPAMVSFMVDHQQDRFYKERFSVVRERLQTMQKVIGSIHPLTPDGPSTYEVVAGIPEIYEVLRLPTGTTVTEKHFDFLGEELPEFVAEYKAAAIEHLSGLIRAKVKVPKSTDPLSLAIARRFRCTHCRGSFSRLAALAHRCHIHPDVVIEGRDYCRELVVNRLFNRHCNAKCFKDDVDSIQKTLKFCGLDVKATEAQLEESPKRWTCPEHNRNGSLHVMKWHMVHDHNAVERGHWDKCEASKIEVISDALAEAATPLEKAVWNLKEEKLAGCAIWRCTHCVKVANVNKAEVFKHLASTHQIDSPGNEDMDRASDEEPKAVMLLDENKSEDQKKQWDSSVKQGIAAFVALK